MQLGAILVDRKLPLMPHVGHLGKTIPPFDSSQFCNTEPTVGDPVTLLSRRV